MADGLSVSNLSFSYGPKTALNDVSCDLRAGQFCALLGPNGAGKSTLVSLLTRLLVAPSGTILIAGHDLRTDSRAALADLGVVFQQPTLDLNLTVRQNLLYFAALHGLSKNVAESRIDEALERLDMRERITEKASGLNGGHRRRMELARALIHQPKVLLLDEPTVGLDAASRTAITNHVHDLADQGLCILWTTHLTDEVRDSDQLLVLHQGEILASGTCGDVRGETPLKEWFLSHTKVAA